MNTMNVYRDPITSYEIRRYTDGPERNTKLYFTCENFSVDDRYFFFHKDSVPGDLNGGCCRADVETGEIARVTDDSFRGFATDRQKNVGYTCKNDTEVYAAPIVHASPAANSVTPNRRLPHSPAAKRNVCAAGLFDPMIDAAFSAISVLPA